MLQYKIPQDVEREDTIIGPITMRQIVIVAIGGGSAYVIFITLAKTYYMSIWLPPVAILSILTICIAFVEIKGIRFLKWVMLIIEFAMKPKQRSWNKNQSTQFLFQFSNMNQQAKEPEKDHSAEDMAQDVSDINNLSSLTNSLDDISSLLK